VIHPESESAGSEISYDRSCLSVHAHGGASHGEFRFDRVFAPGSSQELLFEEVARERVTGAIEHFTGALFLALGASGSGKTFTVTGGAKRFADRGLAPRSLSALFEVLSQHPERDEFELSISFYEVYKEVVIDLLADRRQRVAVHDGADGLVLEGLTRERVDTESDAYQLLFRGDSNRHFERLPLNPETSRGHVFFEVHLVHSPTARCASLTFADLAAGVSLQNQATLAIAKGLDALRAVAEALSAGYEPFYDASVLTQLLRPWLQPCTGVPQSTVTLISQVRSRPSSRAELPEWLELAELLRRAARGCRAEPLAGDDTVCYEVELERQALAQASARCLPGEGGAGPVGALGRCDASPASPSAAVPAAWAFSAQPTGGPCGASGVAVARPPWEPLALVQPAWQGHAAQRAQPDPPACPASSGQAPACPAEWPLAGQAERAGAAGAAALEATTVPPPMPPIRAASPSPPGAGGGSAVSLHSWSPGSCVKALSAPQAAPGHEFEVPRGSSAVGPPPPVASRNAPPALQPQASYQPPPPALQPQTSCQPPPPALQPQASYQPLPAPIPLQAPAPGHAGPAPCPSGPQWPQHPQRRSAPEAAGSKAADPGCGHGRPLSDSRQSVLHGPVFSGAMRVATPCHNLASRAAAAAASAPGPALGPVPGHAGQQQPLSPHAQRANPQLQGLAPDPSTPEPVGSGHRSPAHRGDVPLQRRSNAYYGPGGCPQPQGPQPHRQPLSPQGSFVPAAGVHPAGTFSPHGVPAMAGGQPAQLRSSVPPPHAVAPQWAPPARAVSRSPSPQPAQASSGAAPWPPVGAPGWPAAARSFSPQTRASIGGTAHGSAASPYGAQCANARACSPGPMCGAEQRPPARAYSAAAPVSPTWAHGHAQARRSVSPMERSVPPPRVPQHPAPGVEAMRRAPAPLLLQGDAGGLLGRAPAGQVYL